MKTMENSIIVVLLIFIVLCLAIESKSQVKPADNRPRQESSPVRKVDLARWQTVRLSRNGIEFKLPLDWQHDEPDLEKRTEYFTMEFVNWTAPNKDLIRILITTVPKGFVSLRRMPASKEEMVEEEFNSATASRDPSFTEVKRVKLSGVEGVFKMLRVDFKEDIGIRTGPIWKGFRFYRGKAQEIEIQLSSNPEGMELLRTIFNTIEIEQDKGKTSKP
jgi:hypothetical protein